MVATKNKMVEDELDTKEEEIPTYLIYEILDGIPVYYRGYKNVLNNKQTFEEIMATGDYQAILLTFIREYLANILGTNFFLIQGETGVHIKHGTNPSIDLCIFHRKDISLKNAKNKYFDTPPLVVIEVDTKADFETLPITPGSYYMSKTQMLIDFGVKEVIWIYTEPRKVVVARSNQPWITVNWADEIEILGHPFSIQQVIDLFEPANEQE